MGGYVETWMNYFKDRLASMTEANSQNNFDNSKVKELMRKIENIQKNQSSYRRKDNLLYIKYISIHGMFNLKKGIKMGPGIYKINYEFIFGSITNEQFDFLEDIIYRSYDGIYELSGEHYLEIKQKIGELETLYKTDLKQLFQTFDNETRNGKLNLSFRVFV